MILVAVGANLGDRDGRGPYQSCVGAVEALRRLPGLRVEAVSGWWRSAPVPAPAVAQPDYVNGVVRLDADGDGPDPVLLLGMLQGIEAAWGRKRGERDAARVLDLDIVAMGAGGRAVRDRPDPVLPHPRARERSFVLLPLREVAPGWVEPRTGLGVDALLAALPAESLRAGAISRL